MKQNDEKAVTVESSRFTAEDKEAFATLFTGVSLSLQMHREFVGWLPEIAYRQEKTIAAVIADSALQEIALAPKLNGPQRVAKIREYLYSLRFPELSETKKRWEEMVRKINPDKKAVAITADPCFEKPGVELRIQATDPVQLRGILEKLLAVESDAFAFVIDPFREI